MLLFVYLCDNCDIAGFIEVNYKKWANELNSSIPTIEGACKGLARGLIFSKELDCLYLKNFLKHQKNLPLNENNKAHFGILKRFELYSHKFDIDNVNDFIEGGSKGLLSPTGIGNGNGNGIGNGLIPEVSTKVEKIEFAHLVKLTQKEYDTFVLKFGKEGADWMIEKLSAYKEAKGKIYKSDAGAIRSWVIDEYEKKHPKIKRPEFQA